MHDELDQESLDTFNEATEKYMALLNDLGIPPYAMIYGLRDLVQVAESMHAAARILAEKTGANSYEIYQAQMAIVQIAMESTGIPLISLANTEGELIYRANDDVLKPYAKHLFMGGEVQAYISRFMDTPFPISEEDDDELDPLRSAARGLMEGIQQVLDTPAPGGERPEDVPHFFDIKAKDES